MKGGGTPGEGGENGGRGWEGGGGGGAGGNGVEHVTLNVSPEAQLLTPQIWIASVRSVGQLAALCDTTLDAPAVKSMPRRQLDAYPLSLR